MVTGKAAYRDKLLSKFFHFDNRFAPWSTIVDENGKVLSHVLASKNEKMAKKIKKNKFPLIETFTGGSCLFDRGLYILKNHPKFYGKNYLLIGNNAETWVRLYDINGPAPNDDDMCTFDNVSTRFMIKLALSIHFKREKTDDNHFYVLELIKIAHVVLEVNADGKPDEMNQKTISVMVATIGSTIISRIDGIHSTENEDSSSDVAESVTDLVLENSLTEVEKQDVAKSINEIVENEVFWEEEQLYQEMSNFAEHLSRSKTKNMDYPVGILNKIITRSLFNRNLTKMQECYRDENDKKLTFYLKKHIDIRNDLMPYIEMKTRVDLAELIVFFYTSTIFYTSIIEHFDPNLKYVQLFFQLRTWYGDRADYEENSINRTFKGYELMFSKFMETLKDSSVYKLKLMEIMRDALKHWLLGSITYNCRGVVKDDNNYGLDLTHEVRIKSCAGITAKEFDLRNRPMFFRLDILLELHLQFLCTEYDVPEIYLIRGLIFEFISDNFDEQRSYYKDFYRKRVVETAKIWAVESLRYTLQLNSEVSVKYLFRILQTLMRNCQLPEEGDEMELYILLLQMVWFAKEWIDQYDIETQYNEEICSCFDALFDVLFKMYIPGDVSAFIRIASQVLHLRLLALLHMFKGNSSKLTPINLIDIRTLWGLKKILKLLELCKPFWVEQNVLTAVSQIWTDLIKILRKVSEMKGYKDGWFTKEVLKKMRKFLDENERTWPNDCEEGDVNKRFNKAVKGFQSLLEWVKDVKIEK